MYVAVYNGDIGMLIVLISYKMHKVNLVLTPTVTTAMQKWPEILIAVYTLHNIE